MMRFLHDRIGARYESRGEYPDYFVDYLVPLIHGIPTVYKDIVVIPAPVAPLGAKGCGEGAIHATPAAIMCAVNDALAPLGREICETPASPHRLWRILNE